MNPTLRHIAETPGPTGLLGGAQPLLGRLQPRLQQPVKQRSGQPGVILDGGEQRPVAALEDRVGQGVHQGSQDQSQVGLQVAAVGKGQVLLGPDQGEVGVQDHRTLVWPPAVDGLLADAGAGGDRLHRELAVADLAEQVGGGGQVVVLAESMGTLTGLPLAKRRPDLVAALVATDLYVDMAANEARKWQLTLQRLQAAGNAKGVAALEAIGGDPPRWDLAAPNLDRRLLFALALTSPIYTLRDLWTLFQGFQWSTAQMFQELKAYDARRLGSRLEVPFFLFQGERDVITLTSLATEYFQEVQAPTKQLALIPDAGHFAAFTRPERFLAELLARVRPLAAPPQPLVHHGRKPQASRSAQWRGSNATRHRDPQGCGGWLR